MENSENKWIGKRLGLLRKFNKLKQKEAAYKSGIPYRTLQDLEAGKHVTIKNLKILADFYQCSEAWILTGDGEPFPDKPGVWLDIQTAKRLKSDKNFEPVVNFFHDGSLYKPDNEPFGHAVGQLKEIFDSNDQIFIGAIMANLHSFSRAVRREKEIQQITAENKKILLENKELKGKIENLEERLAALEEAMSRGDLPQDTGQEEELKRTASGGI